jgi:hypothetical protein
MYLDIKQLVAAGVRRQLLLDGSDSYNSLV